MKKNAINETRSEIIVNCAGQYVKQNLYVAHALSHTNEAQKGEMNQRALTA